MHMRVIQDRAGFATLWCAVFLVAAFFMARECLAPSATIADTVDLDIADGLEIRGIISLQLEAFRRGHAVQAYSYASPGIQARVWKSRTVFFNGEAQLPRCLLASGV